MVEKLVIAERQGGRTNEHYLKDTMRLAGFMVRKHKYTEAHILARRTLRVFKEFGKSGHSGYKKD